MLNTRLIELVAQERIHDLRLAAEAWRKLK
jgi:hypothetical protein